MTRRTPYRHKVHPKHPRYKTDEYSRGTGKAPPAPPRRDSRSKWGRTLETREGVTKTRHAWRVDEAMKPQMSHTYDSPDGNDWRAEDNRRDVTFIDHPSSNSVVIKMLQDELRREAVKLRYAKRERMIAMRQPKSSTSAQKKKEKAESDIKVIRARMKKISDEIKDRKGGKKVASATRPIKAKNQLIGHQTQETAYIIEDYPYGRLRTKMRIWVEHSAKHGDRVVRQTLNPKTGKWNKPKKSTYSPIILLVKEKQKDGRVFVKPKEIDVRIGTSLKDLANIRKKYTLTDEQDKMLNRLMIGKNAQKYIKVTVAKSEPIDLFGDPKASEKLKKLAEEDKKRKKRDEEAINQALSISASELRNKDVI